MGVYGVILASALAFGTVIWYYLRHLQLTHTYVVRGLLLLGLLIGLSAGVRALALPMAYAIALKLVVAALYLKLTIMLFRVKLTGIRKML